MRILLLLYQCVLVCKRVYSMANFAHLFVVLKLGSSYGTFRIHIYNETIECQIVEKNIIMNGIFTMSSTRYLITFVSLELSWKLKMTQIIIKIIYY